MAIESIRLQNFRSYKDASFELAQGVNIIVGPNASGKTSLLEAIAVAIDGKSFRRDKNQISFDSTWARIDIRTAGRNTTVKLVGGDSGQLTKSFESTGRRWGRLPGSLRQPVVIFEPQHLQLINGSPENRRAFLDELLGRLQADYARNTRSYNRTLVQRNRLLKTGATTEHLFVWDVRLSQLASQLVESRLSLINNLDERLNDVYGCLAGTARDRVRMVYLSQTPLNDYGSNLLKRLSSGYTLDRERGFTGAGPHRDDWQLLFNGHPSTYGASRGELRSAIVALKIIELALVERLSNHPPLILLDDVFSELDGRRRRSLTKVIQSYQTLITTTDADVVVRHFIDQCRIIPLTTNDSS